MDGKKIFKGTKGAVMDFGDILNSWDNKKENKKNNTALKKNLLPKKEQVSMKSLLDSYTPDEEVLQSKEEEGPKIHTLSREKIKRGKADFVLDLHGLCAEEAKIELNNFIRSSVRRGARKVLIIHGKGNHTDGKAVLRPLVRSILEISPNIGDFGTPERRDGGSGATWALIRQRSL